MTEAGSYLRLREPGVTEEALNFSDATVAATFLWNASMSPLFPLVLKLLLHRFLQSEKVLFLFGIKPGRYSSRKYVP